MKEIFNVQTINELTSRIQQLDDSSTAEWGKMNVYQMLKHCSENEKLMLRERTFKRVFLGRLFGKMVLKSHLKDDKPLDKNSPTHPDLKFTDNGDVESQKQILLQLLKKYPVKQTTDYSDFIHPFFGKMDYEQIGKWSYKHLDHHLRQFGV